MAAKADDISVLRIEFRPGLVQGRDGIQFLDDNIWTMDGNILDGTASIPPPPALGPAANQLSRHSPSFE